MSTSKSSNERIPRNKVQALTALADWCKWLSGLATGSFFIGAKTLSLGLKDPSYHTVAIVYIICLGVVLVTAMWMLVNIPNAIQYCDGKEHEMDSVYSMSTLSCIPRLRKQAPYVLLNYVQCIAFVVAMGSYLLLIIDGLIQS